MKARALVLLAASFLSVAALLFPPRANEKDEFIQEFWEGSFLVRVPPGRHFANPGDWVTRRWIR
jgi:hypothetical protein